MRFQGLIGKPQSSVYPFEILASLTLQLQVGFTGSHIVREHANGKC